MFVDFELVSGKRIAVNTEHIINAFPDGDVAAALVVNFGGKTDQVRVRSTYQEVVEKLNGR